MSSWSTLRCTDVLLYDCRVVEYWSTLAGLIYHRDFIPDAMASRLFGIYDADATNTAEHVQLQSRVYYETTIQS